MFIVFQILFFEIVTKILVKLVLQKILDLISCPKFKIFTTKLVFWQVRATWCRHYHELSSMCLARPALQQKMRGEKERLHCMGLFL